ncbi:MAG: PIG-L family deacetylase [Deltaproteobacteria bacterium]|nr:PIG-L family deacetylase [Deltaproteobacteria bacterium]
MPEDQFIPFHSTDLTGRRVLVLAPHPDDETIGCGGSLALHTGAHDPVKVIFLTNGAKGDMSGRYEKHAYVTLRQEEARSACACLGVTDIEFWPYEDRELSVSHEARGRIFDTLRAYQPDLVYVPSPLEFHPDHRAACSFLCAAVQMYNGPCSVAFCEINQPLRVNLLVNITSVLERKVSALKVYESQLFERNYDEIAIALNRFRSMTLTKDVTHAEGFSLWSSEMIRSAAYLGGSMLAGRCCQDFL